jgi:hypothetical protein
MSWSPQTQSYKVNVHTAITSAHYIKEGKSQNKMYRHIPFLARKSPGFFTICVILDKLLNIPKPQGSIRKIRVVTVQVSYRIPPACIP